MIEPFIPGITVTTILLVTIALFLWGGFIYFFSGNQKKYLWLLIIEIPFSAIVSNIIIRPLIIMIGNLTGQVEVQGWRTPLWFLAYLLFVPLLVIEAVKLVPLLIPGVRKMTQPPISAIYTGLALGGSYGIGEALYAAYENMQNSLVKVMPWYFFTGFLSERLLFIFLQGVLTGLVVYGFSKGLRKTFLAYSVAVMLHAVANFGTMLFQMKMVNQFVALIPLFLALSLGILILRQLSHFAEKKSNDEVILSAQDLHQDG